jgi:solute carrier family 35
MGISFAGFKCNQVITATAYTVVGVMNKMLTVLINVLIWDKHASAVGIGSLAVCLLGGSLYEQAPARGPAVGSHKYEMVESTESETAVSCRSDKLEAGEKEAQV